jgi:putative membrane protein insertion efficiency factor
MSIPCARGRSATTKELHYIVAHDRKRESIRRADLSAGRFVAFLTLVALVFAARIPFAAATPPDGSGDASESGGPSPSSYLLRFYQKYISDLRLGRCQFDPSCSQYGVEAIAEYGFLRGSSLTADRLIRCNQHAEEFHAESSDGRLSDPPDGSGRLPAAPLVPGWLLPGSTGASHTPSLRVSAAEDSSASENARIAETAGFADALAASGDCDRAVTEYKRVAFMANTEDAARWSFFRIGDCYFRNADWDKSASAYVEAAKQSADRADEAMGRFMAAASRFNAEEYEDAISWLDRCAVGKVSEAAALTAADVQALRGLSTLALGRWEESAAGFAKAAEIAGDATFRERSLLLARGAAKGEDVPSKHAHLAAGFSAVLPGSGQMYAGRWYDGLRHLVVDGLLIFTIYQLADDDLWGAAYLTAGITLPFYVGNIIGAKRSAERYNASKRSQYVSDLLKQSLPIGSRAE